MSCASIVMRNIGVTFGGTRGVVIDALSIAAGKVTAVLGQSGSGKSTLLNLIGGMETPEKVADTSLVISFDDDGMTRSCEVSGGRWPDRASLLGFVFQHPFLIMGASGLDNLAMGAAAARCFVDDKALRAFWSGVLALPPERADQSVGNLSGGMKQRVAMGRALIADPKLVLADEPTASLDEFHSRKLLDVLCGDGKTVMLVTHDVDIATEFADDIVVLAPGKRNEKGEQIEPGRLLNLGDGKHWPRPNPRDPATLRAWLSSPPATEAELTGERTQSARPLQWLRDKPPLRTRDRLWPMRVWRRLGRSEAIRLPAPPQRDPAAARNPRTAFPRAVKQLWRPLYFGAAALIFAAAFTLYYFRIGGSGAAGGAIADPLPPSVVLAPFLMWLLAAPLALQKLTALATIRALVFTILGLLGFAADFAYQAIDRTLEDQLNKPELQPIVTRPHVDDAELLGAVATAGSAAGLTGWENDWYGRLRDVDFHYFIPPVRDDGAPPSCDIVPPPKNRPWPAEALGLADADRQRSRIAWEPPHGAQGSLGALLSAAPPLKLDEEKSSGAAIPAYLVLHDGQSKFLSPATGLQAQPSLFFCGGDPFASYNEAVKHTKFALYKVVAVLPSAPAVNRDSGDLYLDCDILLHVMRPRDSEALRCGDPGVQYGLFATYLRPNARETQLETIELLAHDRHLWTDDGFENARQAIGIGELAKRMAVFALLLVSLLSAGVSVIFAQQVVQDLRRPLAVAIASGARWWDMFVFITAGVGWSVLVAWLSIAFWAALLTPLLPMLSRILKLPPEAFAPELVLWSFLTVTLAMIFVLVLFCAVAALWRFNRRKSMASELQVVA